MCAGLVVELEFGAGDVRPGFIVVARAGGYLALLVESCDGDEQRLAQQVEFDARLLQLRALAQLAGHRHVQRADRPVVGFGLHILGLVEGDIGRISSRSDCTPG